MSRRQYHAICGLMLSVLLIIGCTPRFSLKDYKPGTCIQEINRAYAAGTLGQTHLYKIEEYFEQKQEYSLSIYHNNDWYYLKQRPTNFFKDNHKFAYQEVQCPDDGGAMKGLKFRLKGISLN